MGELAEFDFRGEDSKQIRIITASGDFVISWDGYETTVRSRESALLVRPKMGNVIALRTER